MRSPCRPSPAEIKEADEIVCDELGITDEGDVEEGIWEFSGTAKEIFDIRDGTQLYKNPITGIRPSSFLLFALFQLPPLQLCSRWHQRATGWTSSGATSTSKGKTPRPSSISPSSFAPRSPWAEAGSKAADLAIRHPGSSSMT